MKHIFILFFFFCALSSCVNHYDIFEERNIYKIEVIDSTFFKDYNYIYLTNKQNIHFMLLSEKIFNKELFLNNPDKYAIIRSNDIVNIELTKNDTVKKVICNLPIRSPNNNQKWPVLDFFEGKIAWSNDSLKIDTYFSPQVMDLYIMK